MIGLGVEVVEFGEDLLGSTRFGVAKTCDQATGPCAMSGATSSAFGDCSAMRGARATVPGHGGAHQGGLANLPEMFADRFSGVLRHGGSRPRLVRRSVAREHVEGSSVPPATAASGAQPQSARRDRAETARAMREDGFTPWQIAYKLGMDVWSLA